MTIGAQTTRWAVGVADLCHKASDALGALGDDAVDPVVRALLLRETRELRDFAEELAVFADGATLEQGTVVGAIYRRTMSELASDGGGNDADVLADAVVAVSVAGDLCWSVLGEIEDRDLRSLIERRGQALARTAAALSTHEVARPELAARAANG